MAVEIASNPAFQAGIPQPLFNVGNVDPQVTPDGKRFLIPAPPQQATLELPITMLLNWPVLLNK
jgi:hypothetical protein